MTLNYIKVKDSKDTITKDTVFLGDSLEVITQLDDESFQLIYIDPPFNTGKTQKRTSFSAERSDSGRIGFKGLPYKVTELSSLSYLDKFDNYLDFIAPRLVEAKRLLRLDGTFYFHIDYREAHYCKVLLDEIFGRDCFLNEIIWAYDYGGRSKDRWPAKHDTILVYAKDISKHYFDRDAVDRIPYMAPGLVSAEKVARGKMPTDVWWHTIVPTSSFEKTGYPNQKPEGILKRIIQASSAPGQWVLDFFAGSGTTGSVARSLGRHFVLADINPESIEVIKNRLGNREIDYLTSKGYRESSL